MRYLEETLLKNGVICRDVNLRVGVGFDFEQVVDCGDEVEGD